MPKKYIDLIEEVAANDVIQLKKKDAEYGGSWLRRGGVGAWMMCCRKFDRLETQLEKVGYDVLTAAENDSRPEGIIDDIQDLRRYLLLIEGEIRARADNSQVGELAATTIACPKCGNKHIGYRSNLDGSYACSSCGNLWQLKLIEK